MLPDQLVILIGGGSGTGKSTAASELSRRLGIPWLLVDDLRLAFQRSQVTLPARTDALYYFADIAERPDVWQESPERLRDALIASAEVLEPALEVIIENHIDQQLPVIIEGDGILPSLLMRPSVAQRATRERIRTIIVVEPDEDALFRSMWKRAQERFGYKTDETLRVEARAKWLFGRWLTDEALPTGLPVVVPRPWETLPERILRTLGIAVPEP